MSRPREAWRDAEWSAEDFDFQADDGTSPYRVLLAQILWLAGNDLKIGTREDATDAYRWICGLDGDGKWFEYVCDHLGLRVAWVRDQLVPPVRDKCERWLREDSIERIRARQEREREQEATRAAIEAKKRAQADLEARRQQRALLKQQKVRSQWRTQQRQKQQPAPTAK